MRSPPWLPVIILRAARCTRHPCPIICAPPHAHGQAIICGSIDPDAWILGSLAWCGRGLVLLSIVPRSLLARGQRQFGSCRARSCCPRAQNVSWTAYRGPLPRFRILGRLGRSGWDEHLRSRSPSENTKEAAEQGFRRDDASPILLLRRWPERPGCRVAGWANRAHCQLPVTCPCHGSHG